MDNISDCKVTTLFLIDNSFFKIFSSHYQWMTNSKVLTIFEADLNPTLKGNCKISANLNVFGKPNGQKQVCPKLCHRGTDEQKRREERLLRLSRLRRIFVLLFVCGS